MRKRMTAGFMGILMILMTVFTCFVPGMQVQAAGKTLIDLTGFPPTYIQVGENEILLEDSVQLHRHLLECNVFTRIDIFSNMWHVFQMTPIRTAREAILKVN